MQTESGEGRSSSQPKDLNFIVTYPITIDKVVVVVVKFTTMNLEELFREYNARVAANICGNFIAGIEIITALQDNTIIAKEGDIVNAASEVANMIYNTSGGLVGISGPNRKN